MTREDEERKCRLISAADRVYSKQPLPGIWSGPTGKLIEGQLQAGIDAADKDCDWIKGFKAALRSYAVWKDGVQYVGCGVKTLEQALADIDAEYAKQKGDDICDIES